ncbi:hypothetical protein MKW94_029444 [Papaver nudicaule]|uniref:F-box domain-containing protein n=1 Tax=Papaver nudicaule TaxID=74823 RepID=A0AA41SP21_PAPNU|nr:hypothetical protein [Papaver nudicaule]
MSLLSSGRYNQGLGEIPTTAKVARERENNDGTDDDRPLKTRRTSCDITNLSDDCLSHIFKRLNARDDRISFGLTCHQWLHIQNTNHESLVYRIHKKDANVSPEENFPRVLSKLLSRFQHLKTLFLIGDDIPEKTDSVASKPPFFESKVQHLYLDYCYKNSDINFLKSSHITNEGLEALAKCCSSLEIVNLSCCSSITDSGISFLLQNCRKLASLSIDYCSKITGTGFLECPKTLTHVEAGGCELKPEGIKAIISGGGLEYPSLSAPFELAKAGEGSINTEAVATISKGYPLLKELNLTNCNEVELEGWGVIGQNCKNLERLTVYGCRKLCDHGLQALCNGCNKLFRLNIDDNNSCSHSVLELFQRRKPNVIFLKRNF